MTREDFDRILVEEGFNSPEVRDDIWSAQPYVIAGGDEQLLRIACTDLKVSLKRGPSLRLHSGRVISSVDEL